MRAILVALLLFLQPLALPGGEASAQPVSSQQETIINTLHNAIDELATELRQNSLNLPGVQSNYIVRSERSNATRNGSTLPKYTGYCNSTPASMQAGSETRHAIAQSRHRITYYIYALRHIII